MNNLLPIVNDEVEHEQPPFYKGNSLFILVWFFKGKASQIGF
jgi:hypothetical protein